MTKDAGNPNDESAANGPSKNSGHPSTALRKASAPLRTTIFTLVPKVSAALWERVRQAKLRFDGGRVSMETAIQIVVRREGDGVSRARAFPKRCANFGNERGTRGKALTQGIAAP